MKESIPVKDKFLLTINEASEYFNIGQKNMRRIAERSPLCMAIGF